jgi:cell division septation protein DedD
MVMDYREHKPVNKNRPRKQPAVFFVLALFVAISISFFLGLGTGWLVFRPSSKNTVNMTSTAADIKKKGAEASAPSQLQFNPEPAGKAQEPFLTFYNTLPKGSNAVIGSGLNQTKPGEHTPVKTSQPSKTIPAAKQAVVAEKASQPKESLKVPAKTSEPSGQKDIASKESAVKEIEGKGKFVVQLASYHAKKEAEEMRDRLKADGISAYIVESNLPEKGTLYRVRAGRHLDQQAAHELAEKAGKGSILIPE